jgi:hypothetical protein
MLGLCFLVAVLAVVTPTCFNSSEKQTMSMTDLSVVVSSRGTGKSPRHQCLELR